VESSSRIGTELGGYRIDAVLGWGRHGVIYDAFDQPAARRVALEVLEPGLSSDPVFKRRFVREARKAAKLDHPNILPLYAVGELEGQLYTAARFVDGDDLRTVIRREGPLPPARALFILQQAAHALDAARAAGISHRALDDEAILVERHSDHAYVYDFGLGEGAGTPLVPALGGLLEEMLTGQDVPLALGPVLVRAAAGGKDGYASGAELVRAARTALRGVLGPAETGDQTVGAGDEVARVWVDAGVPPAADDVAAVASANAEAAGVGAADDAVVVTDAGPATTAGAGPGFAAAARAALATGAGPALGGDAGPATNARAGTATTSDVGAATSAGAGTATTGDAGPALAGDADPGDAADDPAATGAAADEALAAGAPPRHAHSAPVRFLLRAVAVVVDAMAVAVILGPALLFAILPTGGPETQANPAQPKTKHVAKAPELPRAAKLLRAKVDPSVRHSCVKAPHTPARATLLCRATGARWGTIDLYVDHYGAPAIRLQSFHNAAMMALVAAGGTRPVPPKTRSGACDADTWLGTVRWRPDNARPGFAICFVAKHSRKDCGRLKTTTCAVVYWTYQPEHLFVRASAPVNETRQLNAWWREHRDRFGH
jgi:hypothetical protein